MVAESPERADLAVEWIWILAQGAVSLPDLRDRALKDASEAAARFPMDGRVQGALARMMAAVGAPDDARAAFLRALAADAPVAPEGTGADFARFLFSSGSGSDAEALKLLLEDPETFRRRDALDMLVRLEGRVGKDRQRAEAEEQELKSLEGMEGAQRFNAAWRALVDEKVAVHVAVDAASDATERLPESALAWELRGLAELMEAFAAHGGEPDRGLESNALVSLARAVAASRDPGEGRSRARAILRWFGIGASALPDRAPE